jgi:thiamine pyrophosphokinase
LILESKKITDIRFSEKFDCIICLNTDMPPVSLFRQLSDIPVIAADGAANRLAEIGIIPDFIIGDMDSFNGDDTVVFQNSVILSNPDQETNDFEKILRFAIEKKYSRMLVAGFHGGELEHTLNNWSVFIRFARLLNLCIYDKDRYGIVANSSLRLQTKLNEIISIIPQPEAVITTHNLRWALTKEQLRLGSREGARNRATTDEISIEIHSGEILIFFENKIPWAPNRSASKL